MLASSHLKLIKFVSSYDSVRSILILRLSVSWSINGVSAAWSSGKIPVMVIDRVTVQNVLAPLFCVLRKDILQHFSLLGVLGKDF